MFRLARIVPLLLGLGCLITFGLTIYSTYQFTDARGGIAKARAIDRAAINLLLTMLDAETGSRGYLLSGDERYLPPYNAGMTAMHLKVEAMKLATVGTDQEKLFKSLQDVVEKKSGSLQTLVNSKVLQDKFSMEDLDHGRDLMDDIRERLDIAQQWSITHIASKAKFGTFYARMAFVGMIATLINCFLLLAAVRK